MNVSFGKPFLSEKVYFISLVKLSFIKKGLFMIVGIDDTDSRSGMCTTYLCTVLVDELESYGEVSTPVLVRLNPCIPFKTRGNGAVAFEILINNGVRARSERNCQGASD